MLPLLMHRVHLPALPTPYLLLLLLLPLLLLLLLPLLLQLLLMPPPPSLHSHPLQALAAAMLWLPMMHLGCIHPGPVSCPCKGRLNALLPPRLWAGLDALLLLQRMQTLFTLQRVRPPSSLSGDGCMQATCCPGRQ
jgi:hypothetical protein